MNNQFFNAHHSPIGAFASFTLGFPGASGGLGLELGKPPEQNIYIGLESVSGTFYEALPFFHASLDESSRYDVEKQNTAEELSLIVPFPQEGIRREFKLGTDTWSAGDLTFTILSPYGTIPEPGTVQDEILMKAIVPAVFAELTIDNRQVTRARTAFFGFEGTSLTGAMRLLEDTCEKGIIGIGDGLHTGIAANDPEMTAELGFTMHKILQNPNKANRNFGLGRTGALLVNVPAGELRTYRFAVCFHRCGTATAGLDTTYYYTRFFPRFEDTVQFALDHYRELADACRQADAVIDESGLSDDQKFMLCHAIHSYYGSTELLEYEGKPLWVVNEGEYRMMNTFDLAVDQLFFEMKTNPWTVRNVLEQFVSRYSYADQVRFPGEETLYPGGISFTHDMGVANTFSRPGYSAYEQSGLDGCFSYMTHEQLVNWICCAAVYVQRTQDLVWLNRHISIFEQCFKSMLNRDHPDPGKRNGIMGLDSSRCSGGKEITTYDSLDASLGQARNSLYLAGKCWAAYVLLEQLFLNLGSHELAAEAGLQAERCAASIVDVQKKKGFLPAVLEDEHTSMIIPAIEGLVFPYAAGCEEALRPDGRFGAYMQVLANHLKAVLQPGICLFPDGGWKLSSTSANSWLSKVYLCQFIAREILKGQDPVLHARADAVHAGWLRHPEHSYWSWSDQIINGVIHGSKYYPRGVTAILWLEENAAIRKLEAGDCHVAG